MAAAQSAHDPIGHFLSWNAFTGEVRYYGSARAVAKNVGYIEPGVNDLAMTHAGKSRYEAINTVRFFDDLDMFDLTFALVKWLGDHPAEHRTVVEGSGKPLKAALDQLTAFIEQYIADRRSTTDDQR